MCILGHAFLAWGIALEYSKVKLSRACLNHRPPLCGPHRCRKIPLALMRMTLNAIKPFPIVTFLQECFSSSPFISVLLWSRGA